MDAMLLDLQFFHYGPPTADLNHFIFTSTWEDDMKSHLQAFLNCYHEAFSNTMVAAGREAPFALEQLLKDFTDKNLLGAIFAMVEIPVVIAEAADDGDTLDSSNDYMVEQREKAMKTAMETIDNNPLLKSRFLCMFDDLIHVGLIP